MPFVLDGERGRVDIAARGVKHRIIFSVDAIRQVPVITHKTQEVKEKEGTEIRVHWPELDRAVLGLVQRRIRVMAGTCHAEALTPLRRAMAGLKEEISVALEDVVTRLPLKGGE